MSSLYYGMYLGLWEDHLRLKKFQSHRAKDVEQKMDECWKSLTYYERRRLNNMDIKELNG